MHDVDFFFDCISPYSYLAQTQLGVFGSPTFIVGEDLFFGNDRLDFLEAELKERKDASHE